MKEIELTDVLPAVFKGEPARPSDVWLTNLTLRKGERYIISAESGTGKSSLCAYIFGARRDYIGTIRFSGEDVRSYPIKKWQGIRRTGIAYLPQDLGLFPELTAWENITLKNSITRHFSNEQIMALLARLGIQSRTDFPVGKMSIGQQQRVAIVRTLCQPFDFIFLDEPVSHLDEENNRIVASIVEEEAGRQGAAIIATSVGNHLLLSDAKTLHL
ncbi:MAG: ATP-binding cassette domain-containing protein [Muribaculaceae bacterium]|nr:ATP-binding cassette domain-containing protein [Muribaculaceae bacterium]